MHKIPRSELRQLFHDRSYSIPKQWSPTLLDDTKRKFWRQRIDGIIDYISADACKRFHQKYNEKPKVNLRTRKENIIDNQFAILELLETTFLFPFNVDFVDILSELITERKGSLGRRAKDSALWFIMCMAGFILLRYFGGTFVQIPKKGFTVRLERVNVEIYIEQKIKNDTYHNFGSWFYELINGLWNQTDNGQLFDATGLDYVCVNNTGL